MFPLADLGMPRRIPWLTLCLVVANLAVWLLYQVPAGIEHSVDILGFRACAVDGSCPSSPDLAWPATLFTAMFAHGGWSHLIGNMLFLLVFGPRVEADLGVLRYGLVYVVAGLGAETLFVGTTLAFAPAADAAIPGIGASGAISGVLGAYLVAHPFQRVLVWAMPILFLRVPALGLLGVWLLLQTLQGAYALSHPEAVVGIAFMAHVGGFAVGAIAGLIARGRYGPQIWGGRSV